MDATQQIAQTAARLIVDEGVDYGVAKRLAVKQLGLPMRTRLPDNQEVEAQVREHIAIFHAETQPQELLALRQLALRWMVRLAEFRPHLTGSVWHGTATRNSDIVLQLFCDDPKSAEIALIDQRVQFEPSMQSGVRGQVVDTLTLLEPCPELNTRVAIHLMMHDHDDLRGALKPDAQGRLPRGDLAALRAIMGGAEADTGKTL